MILTIHRGADELGASCVELQSGDSRIVIDFGSPVTTTDRPRAGTKALEGKTIDDLRREKILPPIDGFYRNAEKSVDALLISHAHHGYRGLLGYVNPKIPICMSRGAKELIEAIGLFVHEERGLSPVQHLHPGKARTFGPFTVTPYLVDHAAFDALAFLIEAEGRRIFYSGDFRGHVRAARLFDRMVEHPPEHIDLLLMEGATLGREESPYKGEQAIREKIAEVLRAHKNITFLFVSPHDVDRLKSAYMACLKSDSLFVIDLATAFLLGKLGKVADGIPQFHKKNVRVKFYGEQKDRLVEKGYNDFIFACGKRSIRIDMLEIQKAKDRILMLASDTRGFKEVVKKIDGLDGAQAIYSIWEDEPTSRFKEYWAARNVGLTMVRSSGHATADEMSHFVRVVAAEKVALLHLSDVEKYQHLFRNFEMIPDNIPYSL